MFMPRPWVALVMVLAAGCSGGAATRSSTPTDTQPEPPEPGVAEVVSSCRVSTAYEGTEEVRFDARGLPVSRYLIGDAAGTQYEEQYVRDHEGRVVRMIADDIEGVGAEGTRAVGVTYRENAERRTVEVRYETLSDDSEYPPARVVTWTFDQRGLPTRIEERDGDRDPVVRTCTYDDAGRPESRNQQRFFYRRDEVFPSRVSDRNEPEATVPTSRFYTTLRVRTRHEGRVLFEDSAEATTWTGSCHDAFFGPCSPAYAPPPPGRARARLPRPPAVEPASTLQEVTRIGLRCVPAEADAEDLEASCDARVVHELEATASENLRAVAVLELTRGSSGSRSHHLAMRTSDGWFAGPQIADGPFNGNQVSGTLSFSTSDPELRQVVTDDELDRDEELLLRYRTSTNVEHEGVEREIDETGVLICLDLATDGLRCARVADHVREVVDGEPREGGAEMSFAGDGNVVVEGVTGRHPRVRRRTFHVQYLFDP